MECGAREPQLCSAGGTGGRDRAGAQEDRKGDTREREGGGGGVGGIGRGWQLETLQQWVEINGGNGSTYRKQQMGYVYVYR